MPDNLDRLRRIREKNQQLTPPSQSFQQDLSNAGAALQLAQSSGALPQSGATGIFSGAVAGGQLGGPVGAGIGAGVGTLGAILSARERRKQRQRQAESQKFQNISRIEQQQGVQKQAALSNIVSALRSAFLGQ